ncbi:MAG: hypothetical protein ACKO38_15685 [Planctomycetota bacterium]
MTNPLTNCLPNMGLKMRRLSRVACRQGRKVLMLALAFSLAATGCNRAHYRRQADIDAHAMIGEKISSEHWDISNYSVFVDPRSRMFDPFAADTPPMPKDDPYSHEFMHEVNGKKGYAGWHASGSIDSVENPAWREFLPLDERGVLRLDTPTVLRLARLHSRPYQQEIEELYLSALDVSFERFRFESQFFAGYSTDYAVRANRGGNVLTANTFNSGRAISGAETSAGGSRGLSMRKSFSTGADLVVNFANNLVFNFSGGDTSITLLDFSLVQPLLRAAGRDRILERLTVSERSLLGNVRAMQRYQQAFYVDVMTGRSSANTGPTRRGGVLGGSGLDGFSGLGSGGFGRLNIGATGGGGAQGAGAAQAGGFMGLLQQQLQIRNQELNIKLLRDNLEQLREQLAEERQKPLGATGASQNTKITQLALQVEQSQQALVVAEAQLINALNNFEGQLDTFKINLGLPPDVCVEIVDPLLRDFYLIDDAIEQERQAFRQLRQDVGSTLLEIRRYLRDFLVEKNGQTVDIHVLDWNPILATDLDNLFRQTVDVLKVPERLSEVHLAGAERDLAKLRRNIPARKAQLERLEQAFQQQREGVDPCELLRLPLVKRDGKSGAAKADAATEIFSPDRVDGIVAELEQNFARLKQGVADSAENLRRFQEQTRELIDAGEGLSPLERGQLANGLLTDVNQQFDSLKRDILDLELLQARIRSESLTLTPVELPWQSAVEISYRYRLDLMNARASLVDQWRLIEYNADNLESTLDLVFSGDITNDLNESRLQKSINTGQIKAGLRFDAPIVRLSERNTYRQTLLEYQQAKRNFYAGLDDISRSLRATLRTMQTNRLNFELQRLAVSVAARQNNYNNEILQLTQSGGATAARDTVSALSDLLNAQNNFLSIWVNYEVLRRSLDLDLGTMLMDEEGMWVDPGAIGPDHIERMQGLINYDPIDAWESWTESGSGKGGDSHRGGGANREGEASPTLGPPRPVVEPDDEDTAGRSGSRNSMSSSGSTPPGADRRGAHLSSPLAAESSQTRNAASLANQRGDAAAVVAGSGQVRSASTTSLWGGVSDSFAGLFSTGPIPVEVPRPNVAPTRGMPTSALAMSDHAASFPSKSFPSKSVPAKSVPAATPPSPSVLGSSALAKSAPTASNSASGAASSRVSASTGTAAASGASGASGAGGKPSGGQGEVRSGTSKPGGGGARPNVPRTTTPSNRVAGVVPSEDAEGVRLASHLEPSATPSDGRTPARSAPQLSGPKSSRRNAAGQGPIAGATEDPNRER